MYRGIRSMIRFSMIIFKCNSCILGLECEADHSQFSNADVKNGGAILPLPYTFSLRGAK
jgi:hypothetical protein